MSDRDPIELKVSYPELVKLLKDVTQKSTVWEEEKDVTPKDSNLYIIANIESCPTMYALARWDEDVNGFVGDNSGFPLKVTHIFDFPRVDCEVEE